VGCDALKMGLEALVRKAGEFSLMPEVAETK
jgi:hypothetical protein